MMQSSYRWCRLKIKRNVGTIAAKMPFKFITKGGFRGGRTGREPPLKFFKIRFFRYRIWYLKAYLRYIVFKLKNISNRILKIFVQYPSPPLFQIFHSICATPNFKSWIRPWLQRRHMGEMVAILSMWGRWVNVGEHGPWILAKSRQSITTIISKTWHI